MKHKQTIIELQHQALQLEKDMVALADILDRIYKIIDSLRRGK